MRLTHYPNKILLISLIYLLVSLVTVVNAGVITQTESRSFEFGYTTDVQPTRTTAGEDGRVFNVGFDLHDRAAGVLNEVVFEQTLTGVLSGTLRNRYRSDSGGLANVDLDVVANLRGQSLDVPVGVDIDVVLTSPLTRISAPPDFELTPFPNITFSQTFSQSFSGADASAFIGLFQPSFAYNFALIRDIGAIEIPPLGELCADGGDLDACRPSISTSQLLTNDISLTYRFTDSTPVNEPASMLLMLLGMLAIFMLRRSNTLHS